MPTPERAPYEPHPLALEAVKLLRDLENEAKERVIRLSSGPDNELKVDWSIYRDLQSFSNEIEIRAAYSLNGNAYEFRKSICIHDARETQRFSKKLHEAFQAFAVDLLTKSGALGDFANMCSKELIPR